MWHIKWKGSQSWTFFIFYLKFSHIVSKWCPRYLIFTILCAVLLMNEKPKENNLIDNSHYWFLIFKICNRQIKKVKLTLVYIFFISLLTRNNVLSHYENCAISHDQPTLLFENDKIWAFSFARNSTFLLPILHIG